MTNSNDEDLTPGAAEAGGDPQTDRVSPEDYKSTGKVFLKAKDGYEIYPANRDLPVLTTEGLHMTRDHADEVLASHGDYVVEVKTEKE